ncbi:Ran-binding protein M homolog [Linum perenne]
MPMRLGAASGRLVVSPDKLSVKYNNSVPYNMFHYASVAADKAAPTNVKVYYFEMRVKNGGVSDWITIGFTKKGKNGVLLRKVSKKIDGPLIPTVSVHNYNEEVEVNFGQKPFAYDIKQKSFEEKLNQMEKSESLLRKSLEEKEKEVIKLMAVTKSLSENL